ncbi:hypothetical protein SLEP1_g4987 [Rubroshorea leprosula]|uniref:Uncharacterized protein n=1 Tax=Rubroshorea leprosula TaxID=152421 RepID=A0AAV5HZA7_9ROSI|nr:hypothetical protein SLEP1_g4987 [Rubroshorea leprosula]
MNGLNKLGAVLTILFVLCVFALMAELVYVLWLRRRFRRRSVSASGDSEMSAAQFYTPSKELLYFFCWKNQSRVEPASVPPEEEKEGAEGSEYSAESEAKSRSRTVSLRDALVATVLTKAALAANSAAVANEVEMEVQPVTPFGRGERRGRRKEEDDKSCNKTLDPQLYFTKQFKGIKDCYYFNPCLKFIGELTESFDELTLQVDWKIPDYLHRAAAKKLRN